MNKFRIRAFFREFPFLTAGVEPVVRDIEEVEVVAVKRIGEDFLSRVPSYSGATGSCVGIDDSERIYLFDQTGNMLVEVNQGGYCTHNEAHTENEEWYGESVGEALLRIDDADAVAFAVVVHTGYEIRDHYSVGGYSVTVYKAPKGFTLKGWVDEQLMLAEELIKTEIAEIDAEAQQ